MKYYILIPFLLLLACTKPPADNSFLQTLEKLPNLEKSWTVSSEDTIDWESQTNTIFKSYNLIAKTTEAKDYYTVLTVSTVAVEFKSDSLLSETDSVKLLQLLTFGRDGIKIDSTVLLSSHWGYTAYPTLSAESGLIASYTKRFVSIPEGNLIQITDSLLTLRIKDANSFEVIQGTDSLIHINKTVLRVSNAGKIKAKNTSR